MNATEERPYHGSLLDPRGDGWVLEKWWPGLFDLYTRDGEVRVELSTELGFRKAAFLHGNNPDDIDAMKIRRALFKSAVICQGIKEGTDESFGLQHFRKQVADEIARTLGAIVIEIWSSKNPYQAEEKVNGAINLMKRAMDAFVRTKFPGRGRGNRFCDAPKAALAIECARYLCAKHRRLPTKREVRSKLENDGVGYARSKDRNGKWADLFIRAGLADLPD